MPSETAIVVGALVRIETADAAGTRQRLDALDGVSTFDLGEVGRIGLLIEAADLDAAHALLTGAVRAVPGVIGAWPVSMEMDPDSPL